MEEGFDENEVEKKTQLFSDLSADNSFTELESLCMSCGEQGITRLLFTKIPHFKEIIVMAFTCPHCSFRSNEVQHGGSIAEKGIRMELQVGSKYDLNRQVVKSDSASLFIPQLDFEIPSITQRGQLNTVEGFLMQAIEQIRDGQEERRKIDPETTAKIDAFLEKLEQCAKAEMLFTLVLDDPSGNSFIENPYAPKPDPMAVITHYKRTDQQNNSIGLTSDETYADRALHQRNFGTDFKVPDSTLPKYDLDFDKYDYSKRVMTFPGNCSNCNTPCETRMVAVDIPFFKEVIIMSSSCDGCGFKSNEVKAGGAISPKGKIITLKVQSLEDMSRNILKSETACVKIPEIEFEVSHGTLGGRFTTVEGLLVGIKEDLEKTNPFAAGDSGDAEMRNHYLAFITGLGRLSTGNEPFTLILDDPVSNSYIQNLMAPETDPQLTEEEYERSFEQNEELGLNDIKTENYETIE